MAEVLDGIGLRVGHEAVFGPRTRSFGGWDDRHGDSSWLAAPFLGEIGDAMVFHQVRHPLKVVRSLVGVRFFADRRPAFLHGDDLYTRLKWRARVQLMRAGHVPHSDHGPRPHKVYREFLATYAPGLWEPATQPERALAYWVTWTERVISGARAERYRRHHVERLDEETISTMLEQVGLPVAPAHVRLVMDKVPSDTNTKRVAELQWADLPDSPLKRRAEELAQELGYVAADPSVLPEVHA